MRRVVRSVLLAGAVFAPLLGVAREASAQSADPSTFKMLPWREIWAGTDVMGHAWSAYVGQTFSLSEGIQADGWRIRAVSGYGRYTYVRDHWAGSASTPLRHHGVSSFADILLGYHANMGALTVKAFAGAHLDRYDVTPADPDFDLAGYGTGAKLVLESWLNIGSAGFASLDLAWTTGRDTADARLRTGWRALPALSIGLAGQANGDLALQSLRAGAFVRYEWASGEVSASAGAAETRGDNLRRDDGLYGTLNVLFRY
ncbi:MAG TPA: cellulose biosynthesis protein BcsS [Hyphomicrobiaceae bacterium]|nr:cellulose biosynthesis protein BcsS [Hyphomicrobiaceae bacterium]